MSMEDTSLRPQARACAQPPPSDSRSSPLVYSRGRVPRPSPCGVGAPDNRGMTRLHLVRGLQNIERLREPSSSASLKRRRVGYGDAEIMNAQIGEEPIKPLHEHDPSILRVAARETRMVRRSTRPSAYNFGAASGKDFSRSGPVAQRFARPRNRVPVCGEEVCGKGFGSHTSTAETGGS